MNVGNVGVSTYDQATILAGKVNWQLEDMSYFRKCGEITASPDIECFGLNCRFCSGICLQFEVFMQHLREQHSKDILAMYSTTLTPTCEKQTQTNAFINMQGEIEQSETIIEVEQLHTDKLNELTQIISTTNTIANQNAELETLSLNLDNSIQLECLTENNVVMDTAQQADFLLLPTTPSCSYPATLSSSQTVCCVENTLPDILMSVDDASSGYAACLTNISTTDPQISASKNGNAEEQRKQTKEKRKQFNEVVFLIFMTR